MDTGDLVCISYNNIPGAIVGSLTRSAWQHVGIVWKHPVSNIRYVFEGCICHQKQYQHFYMMPVDTWININRGSTIAYKKYNGPPLNPFKMLEVFIPFLDNTYLEGFRPSWLRFLFEEKYQANVIHRKHYTCFELIIIIGMECGIYKKILNASSYFPKDIVLDRIPMETGVHYSKIIEIKQNPKETELLLSDMKKNKNFWKYNKKIVKDYSSIISHAMEKQNLWKYHTL